MSQQMQQPITKTKRGRHRTRPLIQCSVCMEQGAVVQYQKKKDGRTYMEYEHPDKIIGVRYEKNRKTGTKVRHLVYKKCYAGLVTEGLPIADEMRSIAPIPNPDVTEIGNGKRNAPVAIAQVTTIKAVEETKPSYEQLEQIIRDLKEKLRSYSHTNSTLFDAMFGDVLR